MIRHPGRYTSSPQGLKRAALFAVACVALFTCDPPLAKAQFGDLPAPEINVRNFGALDDAQESVSFSPSTTCSIAMTSTLLTCANAIFAASDVGKAIEIPKAGAAGTSPAPAQTLLARIVSLSSPVGSLYKNATLNTASLNGSGVGSLNVTWGTDNSTAFQNAANACPSPSNFANVTLNGFTSKGCILIVPNGGASGTGEYMFGTGVTLSSQVSFEIRAMGNSLKSGGPPLSGVRLVTAMPITILTVGQNAAYDSGIPPGANYNNFGGFQVSNVTFSDTSSDGAAIGGLLMNGISEAIIAYCDFENFNGQQPGVTPTSPSINGVDLSYGMKATSFYGVNGAIFNNNIVLLHDKCDNNSICYDGSNGAQDGPIVIGGDIFPNNSNSLITGPIGGPPWGGSTTSQFASASLSGISAAIGSCIGIVSNGPVRMYGTHFDESTDNSGAPCVGLITLAGGIASAKFESSATGGWGVVAGGGESFNASVSKGSSPNYHWNWYPVGYDGSAKAYVVVTGIPVLASAPFVGQAISVSHGAGCTTDQEVFDGRYIILASSTTSITYESSGTGSSPYAGTCSGGGTLQGLVTSGLKLDQYAISLNEDFTLLSGASNNIITDSSTPSAALPYNDASGQSNVAQFVNGSGNTLAFNSLTASGATGPDSVTINEGQPGGYLLSVRTLSAGTPAPPIEFEANGNGVVMDATGTMTKAGSGHINADQCNTSNCVTAAGSLTNDAVMIGGGSHASSTIAADTTLTHALFATSGAPAFRQGTLADVAAGAAPTGLFDFSSATELKVPVSAGAAPTDNGALAYDSTAQSPVAGETLGGSTSTATTSLQRTVVLAGPSAVQTAASDGTTETPFDVATYTFPANYWTVGKTVRVTVGIQMVAPASVVTHTYKLRFLSGPTDIYQSPASSPPASLTRSMGATFVLRCASTGSSGSLDTVNVAGLSANGQVLLNNITQPVTPFNTTLAQTLQITITFGAGTSGNTAQVRAFSVEEIN
ncbi:MAG TPA: hypothetical protein VG860_03165 [Terriglobia bacterium]|jgi:hypothetical protein|nr:hypothetical protein [Terriglobia bacterium]